MTRKHAFITGGSGFLGSHLIKALLADEQTEYITVYDEVDYRDCFEDDRLIFSPADDPLYLPQIMSKRDYDLVIHLAANGDVSLGSSRPDLDFKNGTLITHYLLEGMRINNIKQLVFMSSSAVYGPHSGLCTEDQALHPIAPYAASKVASEAMIEAYGHTFGIEYLIFRPSNIVGRWMSRGIIRDFIAQLMEHPDHLDVKGDGFQTKSYILAEDVVRAVLTAVDADPKGRIFNVAAPGFTTVRDVARMATNILGDRSDPHYGEGRDWRGDTDTRLATGRIHTLGWRASLSSDEAVVVATKQLAEEMGCHVRSGLPY